MKYGTMNGMREAGSRRFPVKLQLDDNASMRYKRVEFIDPDPFPALWTRVLRWCLCAYLKVQKAGVWLAKHTALLLP